MRGPEKEESNVQGFILTGLGVSVFFSMSYTGVYKDRQWDKRGL